MIDAALARAAVTAAGAFLLSTIVTHFARKVARRRALYDVPNDRSSHVVPTPRIGGIGIAAALIGTLAIQPVPLGALLPAALGVAAGAGLWDDLRTLRAAAKMFLTMIAAVLAAIPARVETVSGVPFADALSLGALAWPLTLLWLSCYPNAFNFMDGIDGIATLTAIVSSAVFAVAGLAHGDAQLAALATATAGCALGFLPWNFPKARTFMGDVGSLPLGLALALCAVWANQSGALPFPASVLLLGPFLFDVAFTLVRRAVERKRIGEAHKEHLYQRLSRVWDSHAKVSFLYAAFAVVTGALALIYRDLSDLGRLLSLVLPLAAMLVFAALVLRAERMKGR